MEKIIYKGISYLEFVWTLLLKIVAVIGIVYLLPHYNENPIVISVLVFICSLFILFVGDDQIIVYSNKVTQSTNSFASLIFKFKKREYQISDMSKAYLRPDSTAEEVGVAAILYFLLPKTSSNQQSIGRPIFLDFKNGEKVTITTSLEYSKMKIIVDSINALLK